MGTVITPFFTRRGVQLCAKIILSAVLIAVLVHKSSFSALVVLSSAYTGLLLVTVGVISFVGLGIASVRWKLLLPKTPFSTVVKFVCIGQFYSLVLPGQATGELMKAYRMSKETSSAIGPVVASVVVDKVLGMVGLLLVTGIGIICIQTEGMVPRLGGIVLLCLFCYLGMWVTTRERVYTATLSFFERLQSRSRFVNAISAQVQEILKHFIVYNSRTDVLILSILLGMLYQLHAVLITYLFAHALGMHVAFAQFLWIFGIISFVAVFPVTVGGVGVREGFFVYFLTSLGENYDASLTLSLTIFATQVLLACVGGCVELYTQFRGTIVHKP
jgi:glycosyltransferase 2 family protein